MKTVWAVFGGCVMDEHLIALYEGTQEGKELAEARADKENQQCKGLDAYVEEWPIEG